jgi:hypothetical protein
MCVRQKDTPSDLIEEESKVDDLLRLLVTKQIYSQWHFDHIFPMLGLEEFNTQKDVVVYLRKVFGCG